MQRQTKGHDRLYNDFGLSYKKSQHGWMGLKQAHLLYFRDRGTTLNTLHQIRQQLKQKPEWQDVFPKYSKGFNPNRLIHLGLYMDNRAIQEAEVLETQRLYYVLLDYCKNEHRLAKELSRHGAGSHASLIMVLKDFAFSDRIRHRLLGAMKALAQELGAE